MDFRHGVQQLSQRLLTLVDRESAEQLFAFLQKYHRRPFPNMMEVMKYKGVIDDQIDFINCVGTKYFVTPLMIATGKGSYEKVKILLVHGADPNKQCATGDTALNLAVHRRKYSIVDLLLQYHANPNVYNQSGKTALHRAVTSYPDENAQYIQPLLDARADPNIEDRNQRKPLDDAVIANKPGIIETLLLHDRTLAKRSYRAAIIAARLGYDKCLEVLLNYGMDPNLTDHTNVTPLHVAVRSLKLSTVRLLVTNGADQNIANNRGETAFAIAEQLPLNQQQTFMDALVPPQMNEIISRRKLTSKLLTNAKSTTESLSARGTPQRKSNDFQMYTAANGISTICPLLRSHTNWTLDNDKFRSQTAPDSSVLYLLDDSPETCWRCTQSSNAWVIFDLKHEYIITGIRIIGYENQSAPRNCQVDVSNAVNGPWLKIIDFTCILSQGNRNDFIFPSVTTRFIRVHILDNYGGVDIRIRSIGFFGVDLRLVDLLRQNKLENSLPTLLTNGVNDEDTLYEQRDEILNSSDKYLHVNDHFQFIRLTDALKSPRLTFLEWFDLPQTTVIAGETLRTFSVVGDEGVTDRVKLEEKLENSTQVTTALMKDLEPIQGRSLVDFPDYTIKYAGRYQIRVASLDSPDIHTPWQEIVVGPIISYLSHSHTADERFYLPPTTSHNIIIPDNQNSSFSPTTPITTHNKRDNHTFIASVYEVDNVNNIEEDTHLTSFYSIEDSPYCFSSTEMTRITPISECYYDSRMNNKDEYDNHTYDSDYSILESRPCILLKPTKNVRVTTTPQSIDTPRSVTNDNKSPKTEITPTKYKLRQYRLDLIRKNAHLNGSPKQPSENNYKVVDKHEPVENKNEDVRALDALPMPRPSNYDHTNSYRQPSYEEHPSDGEHNNSYLKVLPSQESSKSDRSPRLNDRNAVEYHYYNQQQPQQPSTTNNTNRIELADGSNQIVWASLEYRPNPPNSSIYTYEPKNTQTEFVFKALLQGPDVPFQNQKPIHASTQNPTYDNNRQIVPNNMISSNGPVGEQRERPISDPQSVTSILDDLYTDINEPQHFSPSPNKPKYNASSPGRDDGINHIVSPSAPLSPIKTTMTPVRDINYQKDPDYTMGPFSNPKTPENYQRPSSKATTQLSSRYNFGEKASNQLSDDDVECEALGHDSQNKTPSQKDVRRNLNYDGPKLLAAPVPQLRNNDDDVNFTKESNAQTAPYNDAAKRPVYSPPILSTETSNDGSQSEPAKQTNLDDSHRSNIPSAIYDNDNPIIVDRPSASSSDKKYDSVGPSRQPKPYDGIDALTNLAKNTRDRISDTIQDSEYQNQAPNYENTKNTDDSDDQTRDDDGNEPAGGSEEDFNTEQPEYEQDRDKYTEPNSDDDDGDEEEEEPVKPPKPRRQEKPRKKSSPGKTPTAITVRTAEGPKLYTPGIIPPRPHSTSTTDITDEITERTAFDKQYTYHYTPESYLPDNNVDDDDYDEDLDTMARSQQQNRNQSTGTQSAIKTFKSYGTQSEEKVTRNIGVMTQSVSTTNFGNEVQKDSSSTQTPRELSPQPKDEKQKHNSQNDRLRPTPRPVIVDDYDQNRLPSPIPLRPNNNSMYDEQDSQPKYNRTTTIHIRCPSSPSRTDQPPICIRPMPPPCGYHSSRPKNRPIMTSTETDTSLDGMRPKRHQSTQPDPTPTKDSATVTNSHTKLPLKHDYDTSLTITTNDKNNSKRYLSFLKTDDDEDDDYSPRRPPSQNNSKLMPRGSSVPPSQTASRITPISIKHNFNRDLYHQRSSASSDNDFYLKQRPAYQDRQYEEQKITANFSNDVSNRDDNEELRSDTSTLLKTESFHQPDSITRSSQIYLSPIRTPLYHAQEHRIPISKSPPICNIGTENILRSPDHEYTVSFEEHYIYESDLDSDIDNNSPLRSSTLKHEDLKSKNTHTIILPVLNSSRTYVFEKQPIPRNPIRQSNMNRNFYLATSPALHSLNSSTRADAMETNSPNKVIYSNNFSEQEL